MLATERPAVALGSNGPYLGKPEGPPPKEDDASAYVQKWRERRRWAELDRMRYEPVWALCRAFLSGRQWTEWHYHLRRVIEEPETRRRGRERHTTNVVTNYVETVMGKIMSVDYQPDVSFRRDDVESRQYANQARAGGSYCWDEELNATRILRRIALKAVTYGTSFGLMTPEPETTPIGTAPFLNGKALTDPNEAAQAQAAAMLQGVELPQGPVFEWRLQLWDGGPMFLYTPPGVEHAVLMPWIIVRMPRPIEWLKLRYGAAADHVVEEPIRVLDMVGARAGGDSIDGELLGDNMARYREHAWLDYCFEMPTRENRQGKVCHIVQDRPVFEEDRLPFAVNGQPKAGLVVVKFHEIPDRFWGMCLVEMLVGPQRQRNRRRSQTIEMIDRAGIGRVFATKGSISQVTKPEGGVFELVELNYGAEIPKETSGTPPGPWLTQDTQQNDLDMDRIAGLGEVSIAGGAPGGVSAYAALALLAEQDDKRLGNVVAAMHESGAQIAALMFGGMKRYWTPQKMVAIHGDSPEGLLDAFRFNAGDLPEMVYIKLPTGPPMPRSQAAETQLIFDLFQNALATGQPLPLTWLFDSIRAGRALPFPRADVQMQLDKADLENQLLARGEMPPVGPLDNDELHLQRHTLAVDAFQQAGLEQQAMAVQMHAQMHMQSMAAKQAQSQMLNPSNQGGTPNKPPEGNLRDAGARPGQGAELPAAA